MRTTIVVLAMVFGLLATATAQHPPAGPSRANPREAFDSSGLGMTADQLAKVHGILEQMQQANAPLRDQMRQILGGKSFRDLTPDERDSLRSHIEPVRAQMVENRRKAHDQIHAILTPAQRKIVEQRMRDHP
jgi:Spy/CpxP family protein refolding chaperone